VQALAVSRSRCCDDLGWPIMSALDITRNNFVGHCCQVVDEANAKDDEVSSLTHMYMKCASGAAVAVRRLGRK
jgi:hypothetical protein